MTTTTARKIKQARVEVGFWRWSIILGVDIWIFEGLDTVSVRGIEFARVLDFTSARIRKSGWATQLVLAYVLDPVFIIWFEGKWELGYLDLVLKKDRVFIGWIPILNLFLELIRADSTARDIDYIAVSDCLLIDEELVTFQKIQVVDLSVPLRHILVESLFFVVVFEEVLVDEISADGCQVSVDIEVFEIILTIYQSHRINVNRVIVYSFLFDLSYQFFFFFEWFRSEIFRVIFWVLEGGVGYNLLEFD